MTGSVIGAIGSCAAAMPTPGSTSTTVGPVSVGRHQLGRQLHLRRQTRTAGRHLGVATAATTAGSRRFTRIPWPWPRPPRPPGRAVILVLVVALTGFLGWWRRLFCFRRRGRRLRRRSRGVSRRHLRRRSPGRCHCCRCCRSCRCSGFRRRRCRCRRRFLAVVALLLVAFGASGRRDRCRAAPPCAPPPGEFVLLIRAGLRLLIGRVLADGVFTSQRRISKGNGSAGTTGQQARSHEAGRGGDAHTRTHVETTLQGVVSRLLRDPLILAQPDATVCCRFESTHHRD